MSCNRDGCPIPGDHVHLPRQAEIALANVLVEEESRRLQRRRPLSVMKNVYADHRWWRTGGGYDPEQDGPDPQWGRIEVECRVCGERRRIWRLLPLADGALVQGCRRTGPDTWREGDLLVRDGATLDTFVCWLPGGLVHTRCGTTEHDSEPGQLRPY